MDCFYRWELLWGGDGTRLQWFGGSLMIFFTVEFCGDLTTFSTLAQQILTF